MCSHTKPVTDTNTSCLYNLCLDHFSSNTVSTGTTDCAALNGILIINNEFERYGSGRGRGRGVLYDPVPTLY
jgi:hypothetical protein